MLIYNNGISAAEAYKITTETISAQECQKFVEIMEKIKVNAKKGFYNILFHEYLSDNIIAALENLGYEVDSGNPTQINWDHKSQDD